MTKRDVATESPQNERAAIRAMSAKQLAQLGMAQLAYVRPVMMDGEMAYAIHGADGTPVAIAADRDLAEAAIEQQDLVQVLVH